MKPPISILIADDDEDDRQLFIESIKEIDNTITCSESKNGQDALIFLKDETNPIPDYIFLDLRMPRFDGRKCLIEIRKDSRLREIPVIIYTTSREVQDAEELMSMGAVHFISKPTNPDEIYYQVSAIFGENWSSNK